MKNDLDFDEIDRAIEQAGKPQARPNTITSTPRVRSMPLSLPQRPQEEQRSSVPTSFEAVPARETPPSQPVASTPLPIAPRRAPIAKPSGPRSMDIVGPSVKKVSRTGVSMTPSTAFSSNGSSTQPASNLAIESKKPVFMNDIVPASSPKPAPLQSFQEIEASNLEHPALEADDSHEKHDDKWPDVLNFEDSSEYKPAVTTEQKPADEPKTEYPGYSANDSPFLPEAKVEKRPLGAYSQNEDFTQHHDESTGPGLAQTTDLGPESNIPASTLNMPQNETPPPPLEEEKPSADVASTPNASSDTQSQVQASAQMAIPQQYQSATAPEAAESHNVFDVSEYHPPLVDATHQAAPQHKKPWVGLVVAVAVLLVLIVAGYFAFMYFVQNY